MHATRSVHHSAKSSVQANERHIPQPVTKDTEQVTACEATGYPIIHAAKFRQTSCTWHGSNRGRLWETPWSERKQYTTSHTGSAIQPVRELIERRSRCTSGDSPDETVSAMPAYELPKRISSSWTPRVEPNKRSGRHTVAVFDMSDSCHPRSSDALPREGRGSGTSGERRRTAIRIYVCP